MTRPKFRATDADTGETTICVYLVDEGFAVEVAQVRRPGGAMLERRYLTCIINPLDARFLAGYLTSSAPAMSASDVQCWGGPRDGLKMTAMRALRAIATGEVNGYTLEMHRNAVSFEEFYVLMWPARPPGAPEPKP